MTAHAHRPPRLPRFTLFQGILPLERKNVLPNLLAGISLAAMNIPQAMGYAKIAGMPVMTGLYTLLLPVVAFAILGSSRYLVVASDSATAAILAGGLSGLAIAGAARYSELAGLVAWITAGMLLLARLFKLGFLADFLSRTVLIGFLTGVGCQVGIAVLGEMLQVQTTASNPLHQLVQVMQNATHAHGPTVALSGLVVAFVIVSKRFLPRLPGAFLAVLAAIAASAYFDFAGHGIAIVGPVTGGLPHFTSPQLSLKELRELLPIAASCFVMIVAQSSVTARAYASRHHQLLDENRELVGLAAANAAAALSGTFVVNGSPTQTAMVENSGGNCQLAHLSTALVVMLVLLFLTEPLQYLPNCVLGAIVFTIAVHLFDLRGLRDLRRKSKREWHLALITAVSVVVLGVENGILLALVLSLLQHVRRSYQPATALEAQAVDGHWQFAPVATAKLAEPGMIVYWFGSDLFYANTDRFAAEVLELADRATPRWFVVDAGAVTSMDYTAGGTLKDLHAALAKRGIVLAFAHVTDNLRLNFDNHGVTTILGPTRLFNTLRDCLAAFHAQSNSAASSKR